ncbi:MAG: S8 family serine peptidase [Jatrophihabitantaceae bacterium]
MATDQLLRTARWNKRLCTAALAASVGLSMAAGAISLAAPAVADPAPKAALSSSLWGDLTDDLSALDGHGQNNPSADPGSLYTIENAIGARSVWKQQDQSGHQITGQGVTVALLDSGTAPVAGLNAPGKLTYGPDLSIESNGVLTDQDTFGHGTHLAGIIAGRDSAVLNSRTINNLDPSVQLGVAPDAGLLSMKLATTDGSVDVSQVIAGLNWITEHQSSADGSRVRVVNLSFGTTSVQPYQLDPLAAAAENAWKHGLVVVVSGGNEGQAAGRLTDPAIDPYVIAVGASDGNGTVSGWNSPSVASFSSSGSASRHVDLLAPGTSIVSLRDPGSYIDVNHPEGLVTGDTAGRLFRGSGTSQAAAVVSGAVALLLQAYPGLSPDQVKGALTQSASRVNASARYAGAGELNVSSALSVASKLACRGLLCGLLGGLSGVNQNVTQNFPVATGQGSIEAARGGNNLVDADGVALTGEIDVLGNAWDPQQWWAKASTLRSWSGGDWLGATWTGDGWLTSADGTESSRWSSSRWSSSRWSDADWDSSRWSSSRWSSSRWSSSRWSSSRWSDSGWV